MLFRSAAAAVMPNTASAAELATPTGVHQTDADKNNVKIVWNAVPNADTYLWSWSADGVSGWSEGKYDYSVKPETIISQLSAGKTYYVRIKAADTSDYENIQLSDWSQPIQVATAPDAAQMGALTVADVSATSLTITWTPCPGATSYNVYDGTTKTLLGTVTNTTYVRNSLAPGNSYSIQVVPVRTTEAGYAAFDSYRILSNVYTKPNKPVKPSTANFGLSSIYYNNNAAYFGATDPSKSANGYEIEVYTMKGNKKVFTATRSSNRFAVKRNTAYKYRCRFYATYGNEKIYGDWSGYRYFVYQTVNGKKYSNRIKMSWKKVANAKNYTVSISTKEKGGYKKVKTLSSKSTSLTIRKCGKSKIKKNKTYYVKVVANLKDGKKSVKSDTYYVGKAY